MGLWDWLMKKKEIEEVKSERVKEEELKNWLENKKNEIKKQEENFFQLIKERIDKLAEELKDEISALKNVEVEEKKAEEKIKLVVRENLNNYTYYLEKLRERLKEIKEEREIIEKINSTFEDFKKKSKMSYEKATFLIGKEIEKVKDSIRDFFSDLEKIVKENQELIDKAKIISSIGIKIEKANGIKRLKEEIKEIVKSYDNNIKNLKEKVLLKEKGIEEIKTSEKFIEEEKKRQELEKKRQEQEEEISKLRESVDFKALAKFYHSFEKEMEIIKAYKENFREQFSKTNGEELLNLLAESRIQDVGILNRIEKIRELKKEIYEKRADNFGIEEIESEIKKINSEIKTIDDEKFTEEKRCEKLEKSLGELNVLLKEELLRINVEVR